MNNLLAIPMILTAVMMLSVIPLSYAEISVVQENLTAQEQKVLDDIAEAKANGTYVAPPEAEFTANIQLYSEDVIIAAPFPVGDWYCGEKIFKMGIPQITCTIIGTIPEGMSLWNEQENQWIPDSIIQEEAEKEAQIKAAENLSPEDKQLQAVENLINNLKQKRNPTASDIQAIENFDSFTVCMRGLEDTEAFQTRNQFVVPVESLQLVNGQWTVVIPEFENGNYDFGRNSGITGQLYMAGEECKAQMKMMGYTTPDHYRNKVMNEDDFQPRHQDQVSLGKATEEFGTDFMDRQDGDPAAEADRAWDALCLSNKVTDKYRKDIGCPSPYIGLYDETREPSGFTLETASPNINHERWATTCGLIPDNGHIVNKIYWDYLNSLAGKYNCAHWDRIIPIGFFHDKTWNQEMIDEKIAQYLEESQK